MNNIGDIPILKHSQKKLEMAIKNMPEKTMVTWEELAQIADLSLDDLKGKYRFVIESLKRVLAKYHSKILISVRGKGYIIGTPLHIMEHSEKRRKNTRKTFKRNLFNLNTIDLRYLNEKDKLKIINEQAKNGLMLIVHKSCENKLLNNEKTKINKISETEILKSLIHKSEEM